MFNFKKILLNSVVPLIILLASPFGMTFNQSIILASLLFVLTTWVNGAMPRYLSSILLLTSFLLFSGAPAKKLLYFALSDSFYIIIFSFLLSEGIVKSGLIDKILKPYIGRFARTPIKLLLIVPILAFIMIYLIPQPFSRLLIHAMIIREYLEGIDSKPKLKELLLFLVFLISLIVDSLVLKGDLIINIGFINSSGLHFTDWVWSKYLTIPGLGMLLLTLITIVILHGKTLAEYIPPPKQKPTLNLSSEEKINFAIIGVTVLLWATENTHPIPGLAIIVMGTIFMFIRGVLSFKDLKIIEWPLMIFLIATFSIGAAMTGSGVAEILFGRLSTLFPQEFSVGMIMAIILGSMAVHMVLGSVVTSMSVAIPGMIIATSGALNEVALSLIIFVSIFPHFILPFHNVQLVVGEGYGFFNSKTVTQFGILMTVITIISIFLFYIPWWKLIGIL